MYCTCLRKLTWGGSKSWVYMSKVLNTSTIYFEGEHIFPSTLLNDLSVHPMYKSPGTKFSFHTRASLRMADFLPPRVYN